MLDIGGWEFLIVAFVLVMVVGPKERILLIEKGSPDLMLRSCGDTPTVNDPVQ